MKFVRCVCFLLLTVLPGFGQQFSFYLLALSWSPEYCHSHQSDNQCSVDKHLGFVVHGLWPEYSSGGNGPEHCSNAPGLKDPSKMLDIMPSLSLIQHEWSTHGTCSGLNADAYFALVRKAFNSVQRPQSLPATTSPAAVKKAFERLNSKLDDNELTVTCTSNYLQEVRVCLTKDLSPMPCPAPKECRAKSIQVPPIP